MDATESVTFFLDDEPVQGRPGEPVGVALWRLGIRVLGRHESAGTPRGLYCLIGHCLECRVTVDGLRVQRACLTPVRPGLRVQREGPSSEQAGSRRV